MLYLHLGNGDLNLCYPKTIEGEEELGGRIGFELPNDKDFCFVTRKPITDKLLHKIMNVMKELSE